MIITVLAAVLSGKLTSFQNVVRLIVFGLLGWIEFQAIRADRTKAAIEQAGRFDAQEKRFNQIASRVDDAITLNKSKFEEAADRAQKVLSSAQNAERLTGNALDEMLGTHSYPFVAAQLVNKVDVQSVGLTLGCEGPNILTASVRIMREPSSRFPRPDDPSEEEILNSVHKGWPRFLKTTLHPHLDPGGTDDEYTILMYTQTELYTEVLIFEPLATAPSGWKSYYRVFHQRFSVGKNNHNTGTSDLVCYSASWPRIGNARDVALLKKIPICGQSREFSK